MCAPRATGVIIELVGGAKGCSQRGPGTVATAFNMSNTLGQRFRSCRIIDDGCGVRRWRKYGRNVLGYYMRFIAADEQDVSLGVLAAALKERDAAYLIERDEASDNEGLLTYKGDVYGEIEVNRAGDGIFDEEIAELREFVDEVEGGNKSEVLGILDRAKAIVAVRVLWQGRESDETLEKIDPLWQWLLAHRKGLMQADGEGYYDATGLRLEVE